MNGNILIEFPNLSLRYNSISSIMADGKKRTAIAMQDQYDNTFRINLSYNRVKTLIKKQLENYTNKTGISTAEIWIELYEVQNDRAMLFRYDNIQGIEDDGDGHCNIITKEDEHIIVEIPFNEVMTALKKQVSMSDTVARVEEMIK